ncbi:hypothetical protein QQZ08_005673 [Neonectria magnoliae]|uniref:Uncharacterized protein n=1 Tax=Neonectria magnoliae TaxID=2732573 RepID=A0ABR1I2K6_9HYPO
MATIAANNGSTGRTGGNKNNGSNGNNGNNSANDANGGIIRTIYKCLVCDDLRDVRERGTSTSGILIKNKKVKPDHCFTCGMEDDPDAEERVQEYKSRQT